MRNVMAHTPVGEELEIDDTFLARFKEGDDEWADGAKEEGWDADEDLDDDDDDDDEDWDDEDDDWDEDDDEDWDTDDDDWEEDEDA